jgi:hypothetical protein
VPAAEFYDYFYAWLEVDSITVATIQGQDFNYTCASPVTERFTVSGPQPCAEGACLPPTLRTPQANVCCLMPLRLRDLNCVVAPF